MKLTTPSLQFFKPTLATTLAIVLAWLVSVRPAQAGYTVTLREVESNVVATGSGAIDWTDFWWFLVHLVPVIDPQAAGIRTGSSGVDIYSTESSGPRSFGSGGSTFASSGSGPTVGISGGQGLTVPRGYVSGTVLSDSAIYSDTTLASLGVTPGTTYGGGEPERTRTSRFRSRYRRQLGLPSPSPIPQP